MNAHAMRKNNSLLPALALVSTVMLGACNPKDSLNDAPLAGASIGGEFSLIDKNGKTVRWSDFKGKWRIVYFGYTYCPDACPLDLGITMKGFDQFAAAEPKLAEEVRPIFISVAPQRDTPGRVGEFAAAFSPRLLGLTGNPQEVARVAKEFAAFGARGKDLPGGGYLVDHTRAVYLFDRLGKPIAMLPADKGAKDGPAAVAAELKRWVR